MSAISTFADLLAPMAPEEFFSEYHGRKPLHVRGAGGKLADVMSWRDLTGLLNQTSLWTSRTLELLLDRRKLEPKEYCLPSLDLEGREMMLADIEQVGRWLRRGASMVLNDIDALTPPLKRVAGLLEETLGGKAQANLYCSWKEHQAFDSHFDTHDVYALHVEGEKTWRIYGRHFEDPIAHPSFKGLGKPFHDAHKGPLTQEVTLRPGDLLYIPRGWYHDALASSETSVHIAFGVTGVIGLDLLRLLFERAVQDPLFRRTVPRPGKGNELGEHLSALAGRLAELAREPETVSRFERHMEEFRYRRGTITLPDDALEARWRVRPGIALLARPDGPHLGDARRSVRIPPGMEKPVAWVIGRGTFTEPEFRAAFPALPPSAASRLLADLASMKVLEPA
jgi:bifunctional lysine-specific demethylase and histidyl-hydroxylase MINA